MKGISTVVATILMLMITIALAGVAYMYINGVFTTQTAVNLGINAMTFCNTTHITATVENTGTSLSGAVTVTAYSSGGAIISSSCLPAITGIASGSVGTCAIARGTFTGSGYYAASAVSGASSTPRTPIYCSA